ncbi:hypothetical protein GAYE_HTGSCF06PCTG21G0331 [Galdieria yellowstonensis]|uniref:Uncharacterized protein n=1 Tax=Galdieria yellowstonensis TaxID=3028027 RepID=A0AAV9I358_9RHOD|nr:hypothetical protein GAYE_HTGSCF06PCTG21G0331 [Galdieria yellowstonensis]
MEQDLREYRRLQSFKYHRQKIEKPKEKQIYVIAEQRWLQQSKQASRQNYEKQSNIPFSEKKKLGSLSLQVLEGFIANNNWLCELPLTISDRRQETKSRTLYREVAARKYNSYLQELDNASQQLKKRFCSDFSRYVWQPQNLVTRDNHVQAVQTIPREYVELATWRYQQFNVRRGALLNREQSKESEHSKLESYSGKLGEDYRKIAAHHYWRKKNGHNVTNQTENDESSKNAVILAEREEKQFTDSVYSEKPDALYREEAHKKYESYVRCQHSKQERKEPNSVPLSVDDENIFLSQPAVLFQKSNATVPYHVHYENIDRLPLFHSKVMNRFC